MLGRSFGFVETLQSTVVAFVQAPRFFDRKPLLFEAVENGPESADGALQDGCVCDVENESAFFEQASGFAGFFEAFFGEVDVGPPCKSIFFIPSALAVAK